MKKKGWFIVLEGIDGAGTTTQANLLRTRLESIGRKVVVTCEPTTDRPIGQLIRRALDPSDKECKFNGLVMAMLFAADRRHHIDDLITPHLKAGYIVVLDRYQMSSFAYQAEETTGDWVAMLARGVREPDMTIFVDVSDEEARRRRRKRKGKAERYDAYQFQKRVAKNYRQLAHETPRTIVVNGNPDEATVAENIWKAVSRLIFKDERTIIRPVQLTEQDLRDMADPTEEYGTE